MVTRTAADIRLVVGHQRIDSLARGRRAATRFRDWWYYIAGDDTKSKQFFILFQILFSVQLTGDDAEFRAPVLTVPVN